MRLRGAALISLFVAAITFVVVGTAAADHPGGGGTPFHATLSGANECTAAGVCGVGHPTGTGFTSLRLNSGQEEICFTTTTSDIGTVTAAHIHRGVAGTAPPMNVVVPLDPATGSGCVPAPRALIKAIRKNPEGYYVNVHTGAFPGGAVRGQLEKGRG